LRLTAFGKPGLLHLSLQACVQDISHFLAGQALAFQQRFGQVFDHAPVYGVADEIARPCLQDEQRLLSAAKPTERRAASTSAKDPKRTVPVTATRALLMAPPCYQALHSVQEDVGRAQTIACRPIGLVCWCIEGARKTHAARTANRSSFELGPSAVPSLPLGSLCLP
jgi:hypothetical protein